MGRFRDPFDRSLAVLDAFGVVPLARELAHDELAQVALVVGDEHADTAPAHAGSTMRNTAPAPGFEVTSMRPP